MAAKIRITGLVVLILTWPVRTTFGRGKLFFTGHYTRMLEVKRLQLQLQ
ncbi:MAG: hypothetical protein CM1200mP10_24550 [Candidatus Neomarinimicrobiota bacterium]|nr:MAG: hypothetical protein CM1200mP10_24550 [Candidatus Neomarinimicrobiota bacterium]